MPAKKTNEAERKRAVTPIQVRGMALALPGAVERDHHGIPSYRVNERIFSTLWDPEHVNIMLDPMRIEDVAAANPESCKEIFWGGRPSCVQVNLKLANRAFIGDLLKEAWERKAKKK